MQEIQTTGAASRGEHGLVSGGGRFQDGGIYVGKPKRTGGGGGGGAEMSAVLWTGRHADAVTSMSSMSCG